MVEQCPSCQNTIQTAWSITQMSKFHFLTIWLCIQIRRDRGSLLDSGSTDDARGCILIAVASILIPTLEQEFSYEKGHLINQIVSQSTWVVG